MGQYRTLRLSREGNDYFVNPGDRSKAIRLVMDSDGEGAKADIPMQGMKVAGKTLHEADD